MSPTANGNGKHAETSGLRILWVSNAPWTKTGYGVQTGLNTVLLQELGHQVTIFAYYGLDGAVTEWRGMHVYPGSPQPWGNDIVRPHAVATKADIVISLMDVWVQDKWGKKLADDGILYCPWLPVDQQPAPVRIVEALENANPAIAMSLFGQRELLRAGVFTTYVPHCFDPSVYYPGDKQEARAKLRLPADKFIIAMVAANKGAPSRKCFTEQLTAFAQFKQRRPDAWLYLHTLLNRGEQGEDLVELLTALGLKMGSDYGFTAQYDYINGWLPESIATLYRAVDVLSNASMGEGFGVPILEAQACGTPVVTTLASSMPELTWAGRCVSKVHPYWTPLNAWAWLPDVDALTDAYSELYEELHDAAGAALLRARAVEGARPYTTARVRDDYWRPVLQGIAEAKKRSGEEATRTEAVLA